MKGGPCGPSFMFDHPAAADAFAAAAKAGQAGTACDEKTEGKTALIDALRKL